MGIVNVVIMCVLWLFCVYVNTSWYKECQKMNTDWANYCRKTLGALADTLDECNAEREQIHDILYDSTKSEQEKVNEIKQIVSEFEEENNEN